MRRCSTNCVSCHLQDYQKTTNPNHVAASFPQDCQLCHTTTQWLGATFDHNADQVPADRGARDGRVHAVPHRTASTGHAATPACSSCHLPDYQEDHESESRRRGIPAGLHVCHTTTQWTGRHVQPHHQTTFPLTGAHTTVACAQCHVNGVYAGLADHLRLVPPAGYQQHHQSESRAGGLPAGLRSPATHTHWHGAATFNHSTTKFPLTGAHATADLRAVPRERAVRAHSPRPASRATCRIIRRPPIRTTSRPASRRTARRATPPRSGPAPRSTTPPRTSSR